MNRRDFLKSGLSAMSLLAVGGSLASGTTGCASVPRQSVAGVPTFDHLLEQGARVLWVGAHPDDESMVGAMLAKAGPKLGNPIHFYVLTHGDGGECTLPEGCHPDLGSVRGEELKKVAALYGATLEHEYYWNAPLPVESFPKRHEIAHKWVKENGDPTPKIAKTIREFKPDILLTFDPKHGFTGHPEHQLASRFATAAVRLAAEKQAALDGEPFHVANVYYGLNLYGIARLAGVADPFPATDVFYGRQPCIGGKNCLEVMGEFTKPHRTQRNDMGTARLLTRFLINAYLYRVDPFVEIYDPFEPTEKVGMG